MYRAFGFSEKWISWMRACVETAHADVLVNGSPSGDFMLGRGLRQGDPLSPFLFIIAAEAIGVMLKKAIGKGLFDPMEIGPKGVVVSHLQFADDTLFLGRASLKNALFLKRFLILLEAVSGLKVNKEKCQVIPIKAEAGVVEDIAGILQCKKEEAPFKYLGVMVGCRHRKESDWNYVVDKVRSRLSRWSKLKVSIGGRITLVNAVLSALPTYVLSIFRAPLCVINKLTALQQRFLWGGAGSGRKLIWAKWDVIVAPKLFGGLGVRDLVSFNKALLGKWAWRAIGGGDWLWLEIVKGRGRREGGRSSGIELLSNGQREKGWWGAVLDCLLDRGGSWFSSSISRKVGSGTSTLFWEDVWVGDSSLKATFPRLYEISLDKGRTIAEAGEWVENRWVWREGWRRALRGWETDSLLILTNMLECRKQVMVEQDVWIWKPEPNNAFTVKSAYVLLLKRKSEFNIDLKKPCKLIWDNAAVPRAQATAWRVLFNRIATRTELKRRGVIQAQADAFCPLCNQADESVEHLFVECTRSANLWRSCLAWIGVQAPMTNNIQGNLLHFCSLGSKKCQRMLLSSLWVCTTWMIWKVRNEIVFNCGEWKHEKILGEIKSHVWNWVGGKGKLLNFSSNFHCWCIDPWKSSG